MTPNTITSLKKTILLSAILLVAVLLFNIFGYFYIGRKSEQNKKREDAERITSAQQVLLQKVSQGINVISIHPHLSSEQYEAQLKKLEEEIKKLDSNHKTLQLIAKEKGLLSANRTSDLNGLFNQASKLHQTVLLFFNSALMDSSSNNTIYHQLGTGEQAYFDLLNELTEQLRKLEDELNHDITVMNRYIIFSLISLLVFITILVIAPVFKQSLKNYNDLQASLQEIKRSEALLRAVINSTPDFIYVKDKEHRFKFVNQAMAKASGKTPEDFIGKKSADICIPPEIVLRNGTEAPNNFYSVGERVLSTGEIFHIKEAEIQVDGKTKIVTATKAPVNNSEGEICGVLCYIHDITEQVTARKKLLESEKKYRYIFAENPFPMWIYDPETYRFLEVNKTAIKNYGYTAAEFMAKTILDIRPPEDTHKVKHVVQSKLNELGTINGATWTHIKKDGEMILVEITSHVISYGNRKAVLVLAQDVTEKTSLQNLLVEEKVSRQREIAKATIDIQEKERTDIGKELHDNVNQVLTSAKLQFEYMDQSNDPEKMRANGIKLISTAINEIRKLSKSLVPASLNDVGLISSIDDLIEHANGIRSTIEFIHHDLHEESLDKGLQLTVFRIIQELTTNILKYADATNASIELKRIKNSLLLTVADNGKGFDLSKNAKGIGLSNVMNRAEIYKGKVKIKTGIGEGCKISISFKLNSSQAAKLHHLA